MIKPIFIIGVQKCYTTFYHNILAASKEIKDSAIGRKELHFFDCYPNYHYKKKFRDLFEIDSETRFILDSSPSYSIVPGSLERIKENEPNSVIVICLRDKEKRTTSQFNHERRNGFIGSATLEKYKMKYSMRSGASYWDYVIGNLNEKNDYESIIEKARSLFQDVIILSDQKSTSDNIDLLKCKLKLELNIPKDVERNRSVRPRSLLLARIGAWFEIRGFHKLFVLMKIINRSNWSV